MERIQKVIAQSGYCSRRKAEELIVKGKVYVNGKKITPKKIIVKKNLKRIPKQIKFQIILFEEVDLCLI